MPGGAVQQLTFTVCVVWAERTETLLAATARGCV